MPAVSPVMCEERKSGESRRTTKPIMEKRRRARINNSLNELKNLILDYNKNKDSARHSKLEKADILEMAVAHVRSLHLQRTAQSAIANPKVVDKFCAGYVDCTKEVSKFLNQSNGVEETSQQGLLTHLNQKHLRTPSPMQTAQPTTAHMQFLSAGRLPSGGLSYLVPENTISINCAPPVNVLSFSGILSPASSERSANSPPMTCVQACTPPPAKMEICEEMVWRPW